MKRRSHNPCSHMKLVRPTTAAFILASFGSCCSTSLGATQLEARGVRKQGCCRVAISIGSSKREPPNAVFEWKKDTIKKNTPPKWKPKSALGVCKMTKAMQHHDDDDDDDDAHLVILELMVDICWYTDILTMTSWWNTEEDPRPAGNQWPMGTRGDWTRACRGV